MCRRRSTPSARTLPRRMPLTGIEKRGDRDVLSLPSKSVAVFELQ